MQKQIKILCTRPIDQRLIESASEKFVNIDCIPFIRIEPVVSYDLSKKISNAALQKASVIFTSAHAVESLMPFLDGLLPSWKIFCTAPATQAVVSRLMPTSSIIGTASNAAALAQVILENSIDENFLFFCGDKRRDELPDILTAKGFEVETFVVYKTIETPTKVAALYDAIAFFSPSAVNSYFQKNRIKRGTILFAIGETTADILRTKTKNPIIVNEYAGIDEMVNTIVHHFSGKMGE